MAKCNDCSGRGLATEKEVCGSCKGSGQVRNKSVETGEQKINGLAIGRIVHYRSRTGKYTCPAMITATVDTLFRPNVEAGYIADLTSVNNVHLTVFTPGAPGKRATAEDFEARVNAPISENVSGTYQEWDVPHGELDAEGNIPAGTWAFPQY